MQLIVLLGAELDIQVAFNRFEEYREGFGLKFLQELELAYEYLRRHPVLVGSMRTIASDFSYRISLSVSSIRSKGNRILISAVLDLRQDPERIRERLEE